MLGSVASCAGTHKTKIFVLLQLFLSLGKGEG